MTRFENHRALKESRYTIFHLDGERGLRGGERQLLYLAGYLRARGHDNVVACRRESALEREARRLGHRLLRLPFLGEWDPVSAALLRQAAELSAKPPILHAHTGHAAALAFLASRVSGPPWVVHRRVDFKVAGFLSRRLKYESAGRVIPVSRAIGAVLTEQGLSPSLLTTIPDCLPVDEVEAGWGGAEAFAPAAPAAREALRRRLGAAWRADPAAPWIGNLAAMVPHKDQANFLQAAARVRERRPRARFWIIGEGPLRSELGLLAGRLGLSSSLVFTGQQPAADWLRALDVFVLSSWGEGMGSVLLEAMACRLPIAATTAGGIPEVIADGRTGLLAPPRDPEALAAAALRLLDDPALAERLAAAAEGELPRFSVSAAGRAVEKVYRELERTP
ncbi:MAG: glycosyltransferase [Elusimicrobia bacterium]|nr:glycosyltransferase [Elusimicrobiota bacterium]